MRDHMVGSCLQYVTTLVSFVTEHRQYDSGDVMFLICLVTSRDTCSKSYVILWIEVSYPTQ